MEWFDDVFINTLVSLCDLDLFLYFLASVAFFGVVFLIKKIIFD